MGEKKGKALALELMDDLLNNDATEVHVPNKGKAEKKAEPSLPEKVEIEDLRVENVEEVRAHRTENVEDPNRTEISNKTDFERAATYKTTAAGADGEDRTVRIQDPPAKPAAPAPAHVAPEDKVRASVGRFGNFRAGGPANATEAALAQSESLRIAQQRLLEFEQEIERLRLQNEELAAAGETLRRRADELEAGNQKRESDFQHAVATFNEEKEILLNSKEALQRELGVQKQKNEELELRISTNIQKIRVRERELENRLELMKMESAALIRSKDELILELKRNIDQLNLELTNYRNKNQELNRQTNDKQEMLRRTVKALRLALSMLEGEEESAKQPAPATPLRKAK